MFNSILQFQEKGIDELEKASANFYDSPKDFSAYEMAVKDSVVKLGISIMEEDLNRMDKAIKDSTYRKREWVVVRMDKAHLITGIGMVQYSKTMYKNKKSGERCYLLDRMMEKPANERITAVAEANIYEEAVSSSYRKGGEKVSLMENISAEAVKEKIHAIDFPKEEIPKEKMKRKQVYIDADEDHIHLQKGIGSDAEGKQYQSKSCLSKIVYTYTGKTNIGKKAVRNQLDERHYFSGIYEGSKKNSKLWREVNRFVLTHYEDKELQHIFVQGDGGGWIKTAESELGSKCIMILDQFHLQKYIHRATSHMGDSIDDSRRKLNKGIEVADKECVEKTFRILEGFAEEEKVKVRIKQSQDYILSHWKWIENRVKYKEELLGCSAEGHVSHILSDRMSSRPMGWSKKGIDKMSKLRAFRDNGGSMLSLAQYQRVKKRIEPIAKEKLYSANDILQSEKKAKNDLGRYWDQTNKSVYGQTASKIAAIRLKVYGL